MFKAILLYILTHNGRNCFVYHIPDTYVYRPLELIRRCIGHPVVVVILLLSVSPIVAATSGMAWAGAAESENGYGTAVAFSPNGDIVASGHESTVMITDAYTHEQIQSFYVDFYVEAIEFSSDAQYLIIGMVSNLPNTPATVVFELLEGEYVRAKHTEDGINVDRISISPDDNIWSYPSARANNNAGLDNRERANRNVTPNLGAGIN